MKKEMKIYTTVCDCCETKLESPYLIHEDIDLCYTCAGKIFGDEVISKIPPQKLGFWVNELRKKEELNLIVQDNIDDIMIFQNAPSDLDKIDTSKTTGIAEMVQVTNSVEPTLITPQKNVSDLTEVKSLGDL